MIRRVSLIATACLLSFGLVFAGCGDDDGGSAVCGNGICDPGETAESCPEDCGCGNGVINAGEECDGDDLGGYMCTDLDYEGGNLGCNDDCTFDTSGCYGEAECGNGVIEQGEDCDSGELGDATCESEGFDGGILACNDSSCRFDITGCCYNGCSVLDDTRCSGDVIQTCTAFDNGCMDWADTQDCSEDSLTCVVSAGDAICDSEVCVDDCDEVGIQRCDGDVIQTCEENLEGCKVWVDGDDCSDNNETCVEDGDTAFCEGTCENECTEGEEQCDGTIIQTCEQTQGGCWVWVDGDDCADTSQVCVVSEGTASCSDTCINECPEANALQCNGDILEICEMGADNCLHWVTSQNCADNNQICDDSGTDPVCVDPPISGDDCDNPIVVDSLPYVISGTDLTADFSNSADYSSSTDCGTANGVDAFFQVSLLEGESMLLTELGDLDVVIRVISDCDPDVAKCLLSFDYGEVEGEIFTAPADGDYIVVLEAWFSTPSSVDYEFHMDIIPPETDCNDGIDNDGDGLTDCEDPDCFGETGCETETICDDGFDNDGDGLTDCDDDDCASEVLCMPRIGVWEEFGNDDENDLEGCVLTFTPDAATYSHAYDCSTAGALAYVPGSGDNTSALSLGGDDFSEYTFSVVSSFEFFGVTYSSLFVGSDGYVTFGAGDDDFNLSSMDEIFRVPRIMLLADDFGPNSGGNVIVDEYNTGIMVITYEDVPYFSSTDMVTLQLVLDTNTGVITMIYNQVDVLTDGIVGVANGGGLEPDPAETDFVPPPPPSAPVINEINYDNDGSDDNEFIELYNFDGELDLTNYTLVHYNGNGGSEIWSIDLTGYSIGADGFFLIGPTTGTVQADMTWTEAGVPETNALQNGPDALVLYDDTNNIIDAVAYEGVGDLAADYYETNPSSGVEFGSWQTSIGRYSDGADTDDNSADFYVQWWATPGEPNTPAEPVGYNRIMGSTQGDDNYPVAIPDASGGVNGEVDLTIDPNNGNLDWIPTGTTISDIQVGILIDHPYPSDVHVELSDGTNTVILTANALSSDLMTVYDLETTPYTGSMDVFNGLDPDTTTWTLHVEDDEEFVAGEVLEWVIWFATP